VLGTLADSEAAAFEQSAAVLFFMLNESVLGIFFSLGGLCDLLAEVEPSATHDSQGFSGVHSVVFGHRM